MLDADPKIAAALEQLMPTTLPAIMPGLERTLALLEALGNPHQALPPVVHVAGTNGKGSVLAYMRAGLQAAGLRVHHYSSPHLVKFSERMVLAGKPVDDALLLEKIDALKPVLAHIPATFFEATTVLAFQLFAEIPADVVLLETGLGGRLDCTNVVDTPLLTLITPIAHDHGEFLGNTLASIAGEKAGIIKKDVPCVIAPQQPEAQVVFDNILEKMHAPKVDYAWQKTAQGMQVQSAHACVDLPLPALAGAHQLANAAQAVAGLLTLREQFTSITDDVLCTALTQAEWPARLQRLQGHAFGKLLPPGAELWLDGGHNPHAAEAIAKWAEEAGLPLIVVLCMLRTKDADGFITALAPYISSIITVPIEGEPQAQNTEALAAICRAHGLAAEAAMDVEEGVKKAAHAALEAGAGARVLIAGSLYLAGQVLSA